MASILSDDIRYVKLILLLVKGGTLAAKRLLLKCSTSDNKCIDDYLKDNEGKLNSALKKKIIFKAQMDILFPGPSTPTNLECWDISLLSYIVLNLFDDKLESYEKVAIKALRDKRNELQGHPASTIMSEVQFLRASNRITVVFAQVTRGLTTAEQDEINDTVDNILTIEDFYLAKQQLQSFEGSDEFVKNVITEISKSLEQNFKDVVRRVETLEDTVKRQQGAIQEITARMTMSAQTPIVRDAAQAELLNATQRCVSRKHDKSEEHYQPDEQDQTGDDEVFMASNNLFSEMEEQGVDIVKVGEGSILVTFRCSTISALKNITQYLADRMYEERLVELENALSKSLGSPVKLNISIVLETLYSALKQIEEDANNKAIVLTLECKGSEGVKNAIDCFGNGSSSNALNILSEALSRSVGQRVELHTTIDVDKLENDITELERQLILGGQNIVHELPTRMETSLKLSTTELLPDETAPTESSSRSKQIEVPMVAWTKQSSSYSSNKSPQLSKDSHQATLYRQQPFAVSHNLPTGLALVTETCKEHTTQRARADLVSDMIYWLEHIKHLCSECERFESRRATLKEIESYFSEEDTFLGAIRIFSRHFQRKLNELPCGCIRDALTRITVEDLGALGCVIDMAYMVGTGKLKNGVVYIPGLERHFGWDTRVFKPSSAAIAAKQMKEKLNMKKILIFGWNASNGTSTQRATYDDKAILYISIIDKNPLVPYQVRGESHECGFQNAEGFNINITLDEFAGDAEYLAAFRNIVMPIAREFNPELVLFTAGFDEHIRHLKLDPSPECFGHMTSELMSLANGKVVLIAEVGYQFLSERNTSDMCLKALLGKEITSFKEGRIQERPSTKALQDLERTIQIQLKYWPCLQEHLSEIQNLLADDLQGGKGISALDIVKDKISDAFNWALGPVRSLFGSKPEPSMVSSTDKRTTHDASDQYDPIDKGLKRLKMKHEETSPVKTTTKSELL